jgi:hypothetical protein
VGSTPTTTTGRNSIWLIKRKELVTAKTIGFM